MKRTRALALTTAMFVGWLAACGSGGGTGTESALVGDAGDDTLGNDDGATDDDGADGTADDDQADDDQATDDDAADDDQATDDAAADDDASGAGGEGSGGGGSASGGGSNGGEGAAPEPCTRNADCNNRLSCDGVETCQDGFCAAGTPIVCDDGIDCTLDVCDATTDACAFLPRHDFCSDELFCNGAEQCDPVAGCQEGTPPACVDEIDCTADSCDEDSDRCLFAPDDSICADDVFCNGDEVCHPATGCEAGPARDCNDQIACTEDSCDEALAACVNVGDDLFCSNGVFCDGEEVCTPGLGCEAGTDVECPSDGIACTVDACDEATRACAATADNGACADGLFCSTAQGCVVGASCATDAECDDQNDCNGVETCALVGPSAGTCVPGSAVVCNDAIACTNDSCDPSTGACVFAPQHGSCADTNLCNGSEVCDPVQGCIAGAPLDCDDGIDCTDDTSCLPASGCLNRAINDSCQDASVCNGEEICDPVQGGCVPGLPLVCGSDGIDCTTTRCDDAYGGCVHEPDDSLCNAGSSCSVGGTVTSCSPTLGCGNHCSPATCQGKVYACGDCKDNDGDCRMDDGDSDCFGACDNNESGWKGEIPGQNQNPCQKMDCYFDQDSGAGNDACYYSHQCDPLAPTLGCDHDANAGIPGTSMSCAEAQAAQSSTCNTVCGELTPNGCDCFGCCEVFKGGTSYTVFLGSEDANGNGTCNLAVAEQPDKCHPCTQVPGCLNGCDTCELCLGKDTIPPECNGQQSCGEDAPCGLPGQDPCGAGMFCLTGCCTSF